MIIPAPVLEPFGYTGMPKSNFAVYKIDRALSEMMGMNMAALPCGSDIIFDNNAIIDTVPHNGAISCDVRKRVIKWYEGAFIITVRYQLSEKGKTYTKHYDFIPDEPRGPLKKHDSAGVV